MFGRKEIKRLETALCHFKEESKAWKERYAKTREQLDKLQLEYASLEKECAKFEEENRELKERNAVTDNLLNQATGGMNAMLTKIVELMEKMTTAMRI